MPHCCSHNFVSIFLFFISCSMWVWATLCAKGKCDRTSSVNGANWLTLQQWVVFEHFAGILLALTETRPSNRKKIWQIFRNVLLSDKNYLSCLPSPGGLFYFITNTDSLRWTLKSYTQHWFISKLRAVCAMTHAIIWLVIFALNTIQNSLIGVNNVLVSFFFLGWIANQKKKISRNIRWQWTRLYRNS